MELNIELIEDLICRFKQSDEKEEYEQAIAIENLLKAYKELEETNEILNKAYWNYCIRVSLVEEKIEELKLIINKYEKQIENDEETDLSYEEIRNYASKLEAFEELLEKRK